MRTGLIMFGVIFLILGLVLYFVPMQEFSADTTTTGNDGVDNRTSSANITIPPVYAYASVAVGLILLILGVVVPGPNSHGRRDSNRGSYDRVVESRKDSGVSNGNNRKIVRERTERHSSR